MPSIRSKNAQLAIDLYDTLHRQLGFSPATAWKGIAILLLSCDVWQKGWESFHNVVVYREVNDFKPKKKGEPNIVLRRAEHLTSHLAAELGVSRKDLCATIGEYWRNASVVHLQPNNLVGHAFRSLIL